MKETRKKRKKWKKKIKGNNKDEKKNIDEEQGIIVSVITGSQKPAREAKTISSPLSPITPHEKKNHESQDLDIASCSTSQTYTTCNNCSHEVMGNAIELLEKNYDSAVSNCSSELSPLDLLSETPSCGSETNSSDGLNLEVWPPRANRGRPSIQDAASDITDSENEHDQLQQVSNQRCVSDLGDQSELLEILHCQTWDETQNSVQSFQINERATSWNLQHTLNDSITTPHECITAGCLLVNTTLSGQCKAEEVENLSYGPERNNFFHKHGEDSGINLNNSSCSYNNSRATRIHVLVDSINAVEKARRELDYKLARAQQLVFLLRRKLKQNVEDN